MPKPSLDSETPATDPKSESPSEAEAQQPFAPKDPKVWLFAHLLQLSNRQGLRQMKLVVRYLFVELAPGIPVSLQRSITGTAGLQAGLLGALVTLLFCLGVPVGWTLAAGRFSSHQEGTIFLLQDIPNLILYSLVCPLYVGLGCWLAVVAINGWAEIQNYVAVLQPQRSEPLGGTSFKKLLLIVLILFIALFSTANYIGDILDPANVSEQYWFMDLTPSGDHTLGALGVYYALINFVLLVVTLVSIMLFMTIFVSVMSVGAALEARDTPSEAEFDVLSARLAVFTEVYILAKLLTVTYMVNFYVWVDSPLGATQNIYVAFVFLTLFGVLFVSFPRYFVELQWYRLQVRSGRIEPDQDIYRDIRPFPARMAATVLDTLIIGTFFLSVAIDLLRDIWSR